MKKINLLTAIIVLAAIVISGCKKDETSPDTTTPVVTNPNVIPRQTTVQATVSLGDANSFAIIAGSSVTNTGATIITGDLGLSPGTSIGGFPPGILNGTLHINDAIANQAKLDMVTSYNDAAGRVATDIVTISGNIGGLTLTPGLYKSTSSLSISSGDVTFDALGNADAVFIIQIASTLTTTPGRKVFLAGGAKASNIFWQVGSSASFGTTTSFKGNVIALESITFSTGAVLNGRALARNGAVTMQGNTFVKP